MRDRMASLRGDAGASAGPDPGAQVDLALKIERLRETNPALADALAAQHGIRLSTRSGPVSPEVAEAEAKRDVPPVIRSVLDAGTQGPAGPEPMQPHTVTRNGLNVPAMSRDAMVHAESVARKFGATERADAMKKAIAEYDERQAKIDAHKKAAAEAGAASRMKGALGPVFESDPGIFSNDPKYSPKTPLGRFYRAIYEDIASGRTPEEVMSRATLVVGNPKLLAKFFGDDMMEQPYDAAEIGGAGAIINRVDPYGERSKSMELSRGAIAKVIAAAMEKVRKDRGQ
jgi:hypothetical protein